MHARTEKLSLWFKSFPNGHQAECFGIVNPSRRISENKIMSANFLFMILLGTYMLYARPVTIPVPNLTQIIFQYTSRLKNDQTAGTKYFISTVIWRNMGWKIRVTKWQIRMVLTQKVIFGCPSFLISWNIWVTWNGTCLTAGTASLWVYCNYRGKSEGGQGAEILMPATVRPLLTSALQQRRAICSQGAMIHWNIVLIGALKSKGWIYEFLCLDWASWVDMSESTFLNIYCRYANSIAQMMRMKFSVIGLFKRPILYIRCIPECVPPKRISFRWIDQGAADKIVQLCFDKARWRLFWNDTFVRGKM